MFSSFLVWAMKFSTHSRGHETFYYHGTFQPTPPTQLPQAVIVDNSLTILINCSLKKVYIYKPQPLLCSVYCPVLPTVANAYPDERSRSPGTHITYTCQAGYNFPDNTFTRTITCSFSGLWIKPTNFADCKRKGHILNEYGFAVNLQKILIMPKKRNGHIKKPF